MTARRIATAVALLAALIGAVSIGAKPIADALADGKASSDLMVKPGPSYIHKLPDAPKGMSQ